MQIRNPLVCDASISSLYAINPHSLSTLFHRQTELGSLFITFDGNGRIMSTARLELPYPCNIELEQAVDGVPSQIPTLKFLTPPSTPKSHPGA